MNTVSEEVEAPNTPLSVSEVCSIKQRNEKDENEKKKKEKITTYSSQLCHRFYGLQIHKINR